VRNEYICVSAAALLVFNGSRYAAVHILLGFMIPFRPSISISIPSPIQSDGSLLQNTFTETLGSSGQHQIGTAAVKSIIISPLQVAFLMWFAGAAVVPVVSLGPTCSLYAGTEAMEF